MPETLFQFQEKCDERRSQTASRALGADHGLRMILGMVTRAGRTEEWRPGIISARICGGGETQDFSATRGPKISGVTVMRGGRVTALEWSLRSNV